MLTAPSDSVGLDCYPMQLVTPSVVAMAVRILMMTLMMVFHVSVFIFSLIALCFKGCYFGEVPKSGRVGFLEVRKSRSPVITLVGV